MIATSLETVSNASAESRSPSGRLAAQHPSTIHKSQPNSDPSIPIKVDKGNSSSIKPKPAPGAGPSITNHPRSAAELKVDKGNYNRIKPKALKVMCFVGVSGAISGTRTFVQLLILEVPVFLLYHRRTQP